MAFSDWMQGATLGNAPCANNLGWCYYNGRGTEQNYLTALQFFGLAIRQSGGSNAYAEDMINKLLANGYVTQDQVNAAIAG